MKQCKLNYRFHNPNLEATTADYILKILIQSNAGKVEQAIQMANLSNNQNKEAQECSA